MIRPSARGVADWLSLAAAPSFAAMALVTALWSRPLDALCGQEVGFAMGGMSQMYMLMSVFHAVPWLRRASASQSGKV